MKILLATGIYPPDVGGPSQYAYHLREEFTSLGHDVPVVKFGKKLRRLPLPLRYLFFFFHIVWNIRGVDFLVAFDTQSAGFPATLAAYMFHKPIFVRIGGDFLWESYVEKTKRPLPLRKFYEEKPELPYKLKLILFLTKWIFKNATSLVFNSSWQKEIFTRVYHLDAEKCFVAENFFGEKIATLPPTKKNYLWAGRDIFLKNIPVLRQAFAKAQSVHPEIELDVFYDISHEDLQKKIQECYAVILPSLTDIAPNFILDAVRAGKPFLMTEESAFRETLSDIGIFFDPLVELDIQEKLVFLAESKNYEVYQRKVADFYSPRPWSKVAEEYLQLYKKVCAS